MFSANIYYYGYGCFFFKQKTAYEMRISDWSSDVCSSDLPGDAVGEAAPRAVVGLAGGTAAAPRENRFRSQPRHPALRRRRHLARRPDRGSVLGRRPAEAAGAHRPPEQKAPRAMNPVLVSYAALFVAIVFEVIGTSFLQQTNQWTRLTPTLCMGASYAVAFYLLSITLTTMPIGIAYAIWSGLGIVLISLVGLFVFKQTLDLPAVIGLGLIVAGVIVVNVFSDSVRH